MEKTSPVKAIRSHCLWCCKYKSREVRLCPASGCPLHPFRFGKSPYYGKGKPDGMTASQVNPVKVIRAYCKGNCFESDQAHPCAEESCPLYPFRKGKNPFRAERTPAQIARAEEAGKRLAAAHFDQKNKED